MGDAPSVLLLAEDNPDHADLVRWALEDRGLFDRIVHLWDGEAALDYLLRRGAYADAAAHPLPRALLLDIRMPKVDGFEVLRAAKRTPGLEKIPALILTSSEAESDIRRAEELGADGYFVKPLDVRRFEAFLREFGIVRGGAKAP